jgi:hypothetical protein
MRNHFKILFSPSTIEARFSWLQGRLRCVCDGRLHSLGAHGRRLRAGPLPGCQHRPVAPVLPGALQAGRRAAGAVLRLRGGGHARAAGGGASLGGGSAGGEAQESGGEAVPLLQLALVAGGGRRGEGRNTPVLLCYLSLSSLMIFLQSIWCSCHCPVLPLLSYVLVFLYFCIVRRADSPHAFLVEFSYFTSIYKFGFSGLLCFSRRLVGHPEREHVPPSLASWAERAVAGKVAKWKRPCLPLLANIATLPHGTRPACLPAVLAHRSLPRHRALPIAG